MGRSISVSIVYGYDLGGKEGEWTCIPHDREKYRYAYPSWVKLDEDGDPDEAEAEGLPQQCTDRLAAVALAEAGFTEPEPDFRANWDAYQAWMQRRSTALGTAQVGSGPDELELEDYGTYDYCGYVLGINVAYGNALTPFELESFAPEGSVQRTEWDHRLDWAIGALGIKPAAEKPQFFIVASYG